jgi:RNA recognition motif-containing protein
LSKKLFVGNLPFTTTEQDIRDMLEEYGEIKDLAMIHDRETGRFRGFCFAEMEDSAANAAINALNGKDVGGRPIKVNEAKPREERPGGRDDKRGGGRGGSFGGGGNRGGSRGGGGNRGGGRSDFGGGGNRRDNFPSSSGGRR